jgi:hypothetical protein
MNAADRQAVLGAYAEAFEQAAYEHDDQSVFSMTFRYMTPDAARLLGRVLRSGLRLKAVREDDQERRAL